MITTEDVRRASRTGETLHVGPLTITLENLVRLPAADWDDWMELQPWAARREARRLNSIAKYLVARSPQPAREPAPDYIDGELVDPPAIEAPPRVRKRKGATSTQA
jgi:hypothetical protein